MSVASEAIMQMSYSHEWILPLGKSEAWKFFMQCFENSSKVREWPNSLSSMRSQNKTVSENSKIDATYRLGPFHSEAQYEVEEVVPEKRIVYRTSKGHPLLGRSELDLSPVTGGTLCRWNGTYLPKNVSGYVALGLFRLFFDRLFFNQIEKSTQKFSPQTENLISRKPRSLARVKARRPKVRLASKSRRARVRKARSA
jgi:hypothetical protein